MIQLYDMFMYVCKYFVYFGPVNGVDSCITTLFLSLSAYSRTMERTLCLVEMTAMKALSSLATIIFLPSHPDICQSTIVHVASTGYCMVIVTNTHMNRMAN